jgi:hypothetical protein
MPANGRWDLIRRLKVNRHCYKYEAHNDTNKMSKSERHKTDAHA